MKISASLICGWKQVWCNPTQVHFKSMMKLCLPNLAFKVSHYFVHHSPLLDCMLFSLKIWPFTELTHAHLSVWLLFHIGIFMIAFIESWSNNWCSFGTFQPVFNWFINWETTKQQSPCLEAGLGEKSGNQGSSNTTILEWTHLKPPIHMHLFVTES